MDFYLLIKKIYFLLNHKEKYLSIFLFFFVLFGIFLEGLGVVLLLPISALLIGAEIPLEFIRFEKVINSMRIGENMLFTGLIIVFFIYLFKNIYLFFLHYFQVKLSQKITLRLSGELFKRYLNSDFSFHLNSNTSYLIRNLKEANSFDSTYIRLISLFTEVLLTLALLTLFLIMDFKTTISISTIFLITGSIYIIGFRKRITNWGVERFETTGKYLKTINQGLNGIKEIIFSNGRNFFVLEANKVFKNFLNTLFKFSLIDFIPRAIIEILIIFTVITTVIVLTLNGKNHEYIIPLLAVYVAAAFRVAPACNRIITHVQSLKFTVASINNLYEQFELKNNNLDNAELIKKENKIIFRDNIILENLNFSFNENKKIYENVNIKIKKNKIYGLIGDSGSGKSTFINLISGLLKPNSGKILVDEANITNNKLENWQQLIGYVPQDLFLLDDSILSNIAFGDDKKNVNINKINNLINQVGLKSFVDSLKDGLNTFVGERGLKISGGQRQRLGLARALYKNPQVLVLDEATNSLDKDTENSILENLKKIKDITIIIVSHHKNPLKICDEIYEIKEKKIIKI